LRAIAVTMVVIYHLYPSLLPGGFAGVDVFFVISGFLITGHLWRGYQATGKIPLVDFWGRRARRLVPAAALVLAVTWGVSRLVIPATRLPDVAQQILASALYFQNWQLAHDSVDYLKSGDAATPVQHFWSLSVEEQFYLVWPLLFLLAALIAVAVTRTMRTARPPAADDRAARIRRVALAVLTTALVAGSLAYSVWDTEHDASAAYFVTTTRMWELGVGGLLALAPARLTRMLARQGWLAWAGLAVVIASAFSLSGTSAFPGYVALAPVLGAAALIACGSADGQYGPAWLTSARPMVFLGGISYSLYLWHYPIISLFSTWHGKAPGVLTGPVLAAVAVAAAWLSKRYVEDPVRLASWLKGHGWRSVSTALAAVVPIALVAVFIGGEPPPWHGQLPADGYPGAAVLAAKLRHTPVTVPAKPVLPPPSQVSVPGYWAKGCLDGEYATKPTPCVFGVALDPTLTVALVGDSIAGNWWAALNVIAKQEHWKLVTDLHATCAWSAAPGTAPGSNGSYPQCTRWGTTVLHDLVTTIRPQLVITSSDPSENAAAYPQGGAQSRAALGAGEAAYWKQLKAHGISVAAIRESPSLNVTGPACVDQYGTKSAKCDTPVSQAVTADPPSATASKLSGAPVINMNDLVCGKTECPAAVGNVLVYFDDHHFTQSYSQTLAPYLKRRLLASGAVPGTAQTARYSPGGRP
jgi:peptidoglycan/LPS O-acetylase OafA/YrhL